jgi:hypothetical protein
MFGDNGTAKLSCRLETSQIMISEPAILTIEIDNSQSKLDCEGIRVKLVRQMKVKGIC